MAALGATCRALRAACSDGEVWRAQLRRSFPASSLRCTQLADYRTAYDLEANGVVPELACFYSKATWDTEVLGIPYQASYMLPSAVPRPHEHHSSSSDWQLRGSYTSLANWMCALCLHQPVSSCLPFACCCCLPVAAVCWANFELLAPPSLTLAPLTLCCTLNLLRLQLQPPLQFTINPKTRQADYISTNSPDLVAVEAVRSGLVVRDAQGNAIQGVIPAYITADHFKRYSQLPAG